MAGGTVIIDTTTQARTAASNGTLAAAIYDAWVTWVYPTALQHAGLWLGRAVSRIPVVARATLHARQRAAAIATAIAQGIDTVGVSATPEEVITLRAGQTTDGNGLIEVVQAGDSIMFGWVAAEADFGVSTDGGVTYQYMGDGTVPITYAVLESPATVTAETETILTITPTAGDYLVTLCLDGSVNPGEIPDATATGAIHVAGTAADESSRSISVTAITPWDFASQTVATVDGTQTITAVVTCDKTATISRATLTAVEVS